MKPLQFLSRSLTYTALLAGSAAVAASDFIDTSTLLKNATGTNAGKETIVPLIKEIDTNNDEYPEKIGLSFKVYDAGTSTLLFSTTQKNFVVPPSPCNNPDPNSEDWDWEVDFTGDGTHTGITLAFYNECQESGGGQFNEVYSSFVYVARTTAANQAVWGKTFNGWEAFSSNTKDWDDDGINEIVILMSREISSGEQARVMMFNKASGAQESNRTYKIVSF